MARRTSAFTIVELLIVIAVIAILAGILFPVLQKAREKADSISCLSNLKQLGTAAMMYASDYDQHPPAMWAHADGNLRYGGWVFYRNFPNGHEGDFMPEQGSLYPYVKSAGIYECPSDEVGQGCSYSMNSLLAPNPGVPGYHQTYRLNLVRDPAATFLFVEEVPYEHGSTNDGYQYPLGGDVGTGRHLEGGNYSYCDGHAKWLRWDMVRYPGENDRHRYER